MAIKDAVIFNDVLDIITNRENVSDTRFKYTLDIITPNNRVVVRKVHTIDITRDFVSRYSDYMTCVVATNQLEYDEVIYPNREDLKIQLTVQASNDKSGATSSESATKLYRGKLITVEDSRVAYGDSTADKDVSKEQELKDFGIQLMDLTFEKIRVKEISGVIRDTKVDDILHIVMSDWGKYVVDIHKPDKVDSISQRILPEGDIPVIEFPAWLQKEGGGVYEYNLGVYSLNEVIYVYPLFNTNKVDTRRKLTICSVGPGQMEGVDNTYLVQPGKLNILSTGKVELKDTTEALEYEHGNAVRFTTPNFYDDAVQHVDGVTTLTGSGLVEHGINKSTVNNSKVANLITNNPYYELSRIASNRGVRASVPWSNANMALIYPNMEVTLLYKSGERISSMRGVVIGIDYQSSVGESEGLDGRHQGNATIHLFLDKDSK